MPKPLIGLSTDLQRLWDDGFDIAAAGAWLLVRQIPYVDLQRTVQYGTLAVKLSLAGDVTTAPEDHTAYFSGTEPCDRSGRSLKSLIIGKHENKEICGQSFKFQFSQKPLERGVSRKYLDYHEQISAYVHILSGYARAIDDSVPPVPAVRLPPIEDDYPFAYSDTASIRAGIGHINRKVSGQIVGVIGVGGTGSYIADLVAKSYVAELHLWDEDTFLQHNAFRAPGAASVDELKLLPNKSRYFQGIYSKIHSRVVAHANRMSEDHFADLDQLDFAFLAVDDGQQRGLIIPELLKRKIPFIDVGIGISEEDLGLSGMVRVTLVESGVNETALEYIPKTGGGAADAYSENVQLGELNALNAVLAVIKWKKRAGIYADLGKELDFVYMIDGNEIDNSRSA